MDEIKKKCTKCGIEKPLSEFRKRKDRPGGLGVRSSCKECERKQQREYSSYRFHNDPNRRKYLYDLANERRKRKGYRNIHYKTEKAIKKKGIRPEKCPICGNIGNIIAHHIDYSKWNEIVFCCKQCHMSIHRGEVQNFTIVNL